MVDHIHLSELLRKPDNLEFRQDKRHRCTEHRPDGNPGASEKNPGQRQNPPDPAAGRPERLEHAGTPSLVDRKDDQGGRHLERGDGDDKAENDEQGNRLPSKGGEKGPVHVPPVGEDEVRRGSFEGRPHPVDREGIIQFDLEPGDPQVGIDRKNPVERNDDPPIVEL